MYKIIFHVKKVEESQKLAAVGSYSADTLPPTGLWMSKNVTGGQFLHIWTLCITFLYFFVNNKHFCPLALISSRAKLIMSASILSCIGHNQPFKATKTREQGWLSA